ncbi:CASP8 and FADD-like apoptosis regulator [Varanus komodoensis]|uniref:CASP8 and FADD like apoptosis regulator n=1 Tax=Varanus komodoensis TaxID=61221 RepID=A0A8D2J4L7_VARKO|nr:CASP8 and FADD-like apoptosis regulator [Varanus komodoensis]XP_044287630.1 CASP8 and FADD-like apoptosis regulator [Varanus komodoensis]XP_044287631.1 CASP8 and FADD-like apoptosis regulator [Varanus komodoensis]XP_044287633.1 CASP8 and FADD-like apoptosis regulator [Varanus komodoensis]
MTVYGVPAAHLHQIEQELDTDEKEAMLFLCRDLVPDLPMPDVRKLLLTLSERSMLTPVSLSELLYRMKRYDLLKKVLGTRKAAVEANLAMCPQMVSKYRVLMTEISEDLDKDDLNSLVFLLMNDLGMSHVKMAKDKSFLAIITELEKLDLVSPNHLDLIETCFLNIHRKDLAKRIQQYKWEAPVHPTGSSLKCANALQASFPELSLADPPGIVNKERLLNGARAVQAEQIHLSIPETGGTLPQASGKYRMQSQPLGVCLIIDCIGNDAVMIAKSFKALCFEVRCHLFLTMDSMMRELYEVARLRQHRDYDCFVCVMVSRGDHQGVFCTNHSGPGFSLERVKSFFTGDRCPDLSGKPKLFFIQNYVEPGNRRENTSLIEADGNLCTIPQVADILWSQSMSDASILERSPNSSSYYLTALTDLLIDPHKRMLPLLDILVELNNRVYEWNRTNLSQQCSLVLKHTLRKKLFLSGI